MLGTGNQAVAEKKPPPFRKNGGFADLSRPSRTLEILAIDDGEETRRWTITGAWISEIAYSDFNTASGDLIEETVTIHYDEISERWQTANG